MTNTVTDVDLDEAFDDQEDGPSMEDVFEWDTPPTIRRGRKQVDGIHVDIANRLKDKEGDWAKVAYGRDTTLVTKIKKAGHTAYAPAGSFEATSRRDPDGNITVWARYVGEDHLSDEDSADDEPDF